MSTIQVQLCGLVFDLLLINFILKHESVGLFSEKIFKQCVVVYTACIILDILSCIAIVNSDKIPASVVIASCKTYLISLELSTYCAFLYTYHDIKHLREDSNFGYSILITVLVGALITALLPVSYYYDGTELYSYGPATKATYIIAPAFIIATLLITFLQGKQMNAHRKNAVRYWMLIEIVAAAIQFIFPGVLLVGFGSAIGIYILYSQLENPDIYLDRTTGCFSMETFSLYIRQEYELVKNFSAIIVCNDREWKMGDEETKRTLLEMTNFLNSFGDSKLFRLSGNDFVLIYDKKEKDMNEIESAVNLDVIRERFKDSWPNINNTKFLYVPDGHIASTTEEFIAVYQRNRDKFEIGADFRTLEFDSVERIREYNGMIIEINDALNQDRIEVYYQPIYSITADKFVSAEALARIKTKDGQIMMPGKFIPVAEESGLIEQLGQRVFEKTCKCIKECGLKEKGIEYLEVNLSVAQCENPMLSTKYQDIMREIEITPDDINLEITESSTLNQRNVLLKNMNDLMNLGCNFSLDDFGTGESNLNYIVDMPVKIVKFDRSMVFDYFRSERAKVVMKATVNMIKELGLKMVAEGVETEEQMQGIKDLGIDYIQGFYYSKPLPQDEFLRFLEVRN